MSLSFFIYDDTNPETDAMTCEMVECAAAIDLTELLDDDTIAREWASITSETNVAEQGELEYLIEQDFTWEQALDLMALRQNVQALNEVQEHPHMQFARWLYTLGHLSETI